MSFELPEFFPQKSYSFDIHGIIMCIAHLFCNTIIVDHNYCMSQMQDALFRAFAITLNARPVIPAPSAPGSLAARAEGWRTQLKLLEKPLVLETVWRSSIQLVGPGKPLSCLFTAVLLTGAFGRASCRNSAAVIGRLHSIWQDKVIAAIYPPMLLEMLIVAGLAAGGTLEFKMGPKPNAAWGSASNAAPFSRAKDE